MILITGGAGYIGSGLVKRLIEKKASVVVIDDLSKGEKKYLNPKALFYKKDLGNFKALNAIFRKHPIKLVIHLAAKKAVGESEEKPFKYFEHNITASNNLLKAMNKNGVKKIIFSSSACVYKDNPRGIFKETDGIKINNIYAFTKKSTEDTLFELARLKKIDYIIFRYFNVAGDVGLNYQEKDAKNIFPVLSEAIKKNKKFLIFGKNYATPDGTGIRDYIHLNDLIEAHLKCLNFKENKIYNLGTKKGTSVLNLIKEFEKQLKRKITYQFVKKRKGDNGTVIADCNKIKKEKGWQVQKKISDMVKDFIKTYNL